MNENGAYFSWLNVSWWIENQDLILTIIDNIIYLFFIFSITYLFIFALFSLRKRTINYSPATKKQRFLVLIPAYREDNVILQSVCSLLEQNYPKEKYDIIVISDQMQEDTLEKLDMLSIRVVHVLEKDSTKTKALQCAMAQFDKNTYDVVILLDADNIVNPDYINKINDAYYSGGMAIQTHRLAKNLNTHTAILDAISEEINNSIFRKGHVRLGFSSALIGSEMAFEFNWFKDNILKLGHVGVDKQLEVLLLKQRIFIEYLEDVYTFDEKVETSSKFYNQRRRWLATQTKNLRISCGDLPYAIFSGNWDYCDKIIQWMMPPRVMLLGLLVIIALAWTFFNWSTSIKWWVALLILLLTFCISIPKYLLNSKSQKALIMLPFLFILMVFNHFRIRGASKKFIHTEHNGH